VRHVFFFPRDVVHIRKHFSGNVVKLNDVWAKRFLADNASELVSQNANGHHWLLKRWQVVVE
jgi:hypothetical protein